MASERARGVPADWPLPEVIGDEDNEVLWSPGHISPRRFLRAVLRYMRDEYSGWDDDTIRDLLRAHDGHLERVREHGWSVLRPLARRLRSFQREVRRRARHALSVLRDGVPDYE